MPVKIHTRIVMDMRTWEVLEDEFFLYDGPLALCGGGGGGGKGGAPSYDPPAPKPQAQQTKSVTEAATAARDTQKDKARKAAGLSGTILTNSALSSNAGQSGASGNSLLGQ